MKRTSVPQDRTTRLDGSRGRAAEAPHEIPARGWKDILKRVYRQVGEDNLSLLAAGVAFYAMLAMFPALIAAVTIYGLLADPADLQSQIESVAGGLPGDVRQIVHDQLAQIVGNSDGALTLALVISLAGALWSSSSGLVTLMGAVNTAYDEKETRSFVKLRLVALGLTLAFIVVFLVALTLIAVVPAILGFLGLGDFGATLVSIGRWPLLGVLAALSLAVIYRYAPDRERAKWRWVTWGAVTATLLWLAASGLFSLYVSNFGSYNETYGSLGAVIVLLMWLWISAFVVLLGAEIDAETEHQTARDSTTGPEKPMGERGAFVADHVGDGDDRAKREKRRTS